MKKYNVAYIALLTLVAVATTLYSQQPIVYAASESIDVPAGHAELFFSIQSSVPDQSYVVILDENNKKYSVKYSYGTGVASIALPVGKKYRITEVVAGTTKSYRDQPIKQLKVGSVNYGGAVSAQTYQYGNSIKTVNSDELYVKAQKTYNKRFSESRAVFNNVSPFRTPKNFTY